MLTRKVTSQICLMHFMKAKKLEKNNNIYHILQTKLKINKDNKNIYKAEKKINNNGQAHLVFIYKTYIQTQSTDIINN